jgi:hypothetical protein
MHLISNDNRPPQLFWTVAILPNTTCRRNLCKFVILAKKKDPCKKKSRRDPKEKIAITSRCPAPVPIKMGQKWVKMLPESWHCPFPRIELAESEMAFG